MATLPQPERILTHESDLDGLVSGLLLQNLARHLFKKEVPLEAWHNQGWKQRPMSEAAAWVCDFSFEHRLDKPDWLVIDHHAYDAPPKKARLIHDSGKSAGLLCYELCKEHGLQSAELDRLLYLSNIDDLFLEDQPEFDTALDYSGLVKHYGFWNLHALIDGKLESLLNHPLLEVMTLRRKVETPIGLEWSKRHLTDIAPGIGYVRTVVGSTNLIVHQLLASGDTPYKVLVTTHRKPGGNMLASFRSRNGEALPVAQTFQGGGHPNACGATLPRSVLSMDDAIHYLRKILNPAKTAASSVNSLESAFAGLDLK